MSSRDEEERELFGAVFLLSQSWKTLLDSLLRPSGLTARQWMLLAVVESFAPEAPTLTRAADRYGTSHQAAKGLAVRLERRGFLTIEPDPEDGRSVRLRLTAAHREFWRGHDATHDSLFRSLFTPVGDRDLAGARAALDALLDRSRQITAEGRPPG